MTPQGTSGEKGTPMQDKLTTKQRADLRAQVRTGAVVLSEVGRLFLRFDLSWKRLPAKADL